MSNGLDLDKDRRSVGPDLGPNCLQRFATCKERVNDNILYHLKMILSFVALSITREHRLPHRLVSVFTVQCL